MGGIVFQGFKSKGWFGFMSDTVLTIANVCYMNAAFQLIAPAYLKYSSDNDVAPLVDHFEQEPTTTLDNFVVALLCLLQTLADPELRTTSFVQQQQSFVKRMWPRKVIGEPAFDATSDRKRMALVYVKRALLELTA